MLFDLFIQQRRELWKTGWMHQTRGSCSFKLVGVIYRILKGLCLLGVSLAFECVVFTFVPSSQTICSVLKVWDAVGTFSFHDFGGCL